MSQKQAGGLPGVGGGVPTAVTPFGRDALAAIVSNLPGRHLWPQDEFAKLLKIGTAPRALTGLLRSTFGSNLADQLGAVRLFEAEAYHFPSKSVNDQNARAALQLQSGKSSRYPPHVYCPQSLVKLRKMFVKNRDCLGAMVASRLLSRAGGDEYRTWIKNPSFFGGSFPASSLTAVPSTT